MVKLIGWVVYEESIDAQQTAIGNRDFWDMRPVLLKVDAEPVLMPRQTEKMIQAKQQPTLIVN